MISEGNRDARIKRQRRVRAKIRGTAEKPRLSVFRSNKHIYLQVIDDDSGATLAAASTLTPAIKADLASLKKRDAAQKVGFYLAEQCKAAGITRLVFDRNGYLFKGRVEAVASAAHAAGLLSKKITADTTGDDDNG